MSPGPGKNPYNNSRFLVEIDGITQAGFSEVIIPDSTHETIEYREGSDLGTVRKIPGILKFGNILLKWGTTDSLDLYNWRKSVEEGKVNEARRNVTVVMLDEEGNSAARWEFSQAWPTKYDAPDLNATGNEIAIESLEIAHEGMRRTQ